VIEKAGAMPILQIRDLTKQFGGLFAVRDLDFDVNEGEILGLIGPNGAGKTTVFNLISGFYRPTKGEIIFRGRDITGLRMSRIAALGLVRTFQIVNLVESQTVNESVFVAHHLQRKSGVLGSVLGIPSARRDEEMIQEKTAQLLEYMGLTPVKDKIVGSLPHGFRRVLGICVALAANPKLLLLDEPTAGLSGAETTTMMEQIKRVRQQGVTAILVEHDLKVVMGISDRIIVLNFGNKIAEGTPKEVVNNSEVISAYLGFKKVSRHDR
jgi:branched-chain amino acid transport system ATP-binding protein